MIYIPPIAGPKQAYSRFRRQGKKILDTEYISSSEEPGAPIGRRRKGDRRKRQHNVLLDRRSIQNRRNNHEFTRRSSTLKETKKNQRKGMNINTTA